MSTIQPKNGGIFLTMSIILWMICLWYFVFRECNTLSIGWAFEAVFGGRNTSFIAFKPSISSMNWWNQTIVLTSLQFMIRKIRQLLVIWRKETLESLQRQFFTSSEVITYCSCYAEISGKWCNLKDGEGLQVPCKIIIIG